MKAIEYFEKYFKDENKFNTEEFKLDCLHFLEDLFNEFQDMITDFHINPSIKSAIYYNSDQMKQFVIVNQKFVDIMNDVEQIYDYRPLKDNEFELYLAHVSENGGDDGYVPRVNKKFGKKITCRKCAYYAPEEQICTLISSKKHLVYKDPKFSCRLGVKRKKGNDIENVYN